MEDLQLTETEQRYFGDLFLLCADPGRDRNNKGTSSEPSQTIPIVRACELFRTSKLSNETVRQITELCSNGTTTEMGRKEFYTALKLIAAAQNGKPISDLNDSRCATLPRFTWPAEESDEVVRSRGHSPATSSTASDSPTPTNSVQDRTWIPDAASEEQRQLLGTEEESSDRHSSDDDTQTQTLSDKNGQEDLESQLWTITPEQKDYYSKQFSALQPQSNGLLAGSRARQFFEKSRLPVHELRKIWQLADVTKDGALSLDEFNTAMHLVVLRRNNIPLPSALPPSLFIPLPTPPSQSAPSSNPNKQWTKFAESPTGSISSTGAVVSSPGPKPVNFDFHPSAVEQDPKIFHPVPLRVTPEHAKGDAAADSEVVRRRGSDMTPLPNEEATAGRRSLLPAQSLDSAIQRPQPRKPHGHGHTPGALPPPPHLPSSSANDFEYSGPTSLPVVSGSVVPPRAEPPPPPPRPNNSASTNSYHAAIAQDVPVRTHGRSSSLDLTRFQLLGGRSSLLAAPPQLPPRTSPSSTTPPRSRDGTCVSAFPPAEDEGIAEVDNGPPRRHGAFQVYRKNLVSPPADASHDSLRKLENQNRALARLCLELNQELIEIQETRTQLQLRLEQLQKRYDMEF